MGRYRPPPPPRSSYITPQGAARLQAELDRLWRTERPAVTRSVAAAAAQGDRSENAEYIYGKKQLAAIDRRVRHLRKRLQVLRIVDGRPDDAGRVFFGAWLELEDAEGGLCRFRLVGPDEFDHAPGYLSVDSPLGKAVLGKSLDEEVSVATPRGPRRYTIVGIRYAAPEDERDKKKARRGAGRVTGGTEG